MTPEEALAAPEQPVLSEPVSTILQSPPHLKRASASTCPNDLTAREIEVLRLLTQGLTNPQIAERLIISPLTVSAHLRSIYSKIGVTSRSAATRYALEHHLV